MILRKKKQEIPILTTQFGQPTKPLRDRLETLTKCVYTTQVMWEELCGYYDDLSVEIDKNEIIVFNEDVTDLGVAKNLPDALASALLQTIGQRKEDGKK